MANNFNGEEPNVEGLVGEFLGRTPWDDEIACMDIVRLYTETVTRFLKNRTSRRERDDRNMENSDED